MNRRIIRAIALKDLREVRHNRLAWMPMLVTPIIFVVVLPLVFLLIPNVVSSSGGTKSINDLAALLQTMPLPLRDQITGMNDSQSMIYLLLGYVLAPMFLIIPIITGSVIGAESFAGEKERRTIEALLYTPASERELFFGKMIAAVVPAIALTWGSFIAYIIVLNTVGGSIMGRIWFPTPTWWPLILWVAPAVALAGNMASVLISARVNTFMEAYQAGSALVLPLMVLVLGQIGGVVYLGVELTIVVGLFIWLIDGLLLWFALKLFSRARLMGSSTIQKQG